MISAGSAGNARLSIDEIAANPERASSLSAAQRLVIVQRCAAVILLVSELSEHCDDAPARDDSRARIVDDGRLLTPQELAALMNAKLSWVYAHGSKLPFAIRLPGQRKVRQYSYTGLLRWIRAREGR